MTSHLNFFIELEHLECGIICPASTRSTDQGSIDKSLSTLTPEEARKVKRKFRKLARKKIPPDRWQTMTRRQKRNRVLSYLWGKALNRYYALLPEDNFE